MHGVRLYGVWGGMKRSRKWQFFCLIRLNTCSICLPLLYDGRLLPQKNRRSFFQLKASYGKALQFLQAPHSPINNNQENVATGWEKNIIVSK